MTLSAPKDGTVTGLKAELVADMGAYLSLLGGGFQRWARSCSTGSTSSTPTGSTSYGLHQQDWTDAYRGAGQSGSDLRVERIMDELAHEKGMRREERG